MLVFSESLVPTVRKALCDPLEEVREAAAKTFEQLHATIGHQALDDILPTLLKQLVRWRGEGGGRGWCSFFLFFSIEFILNIYSKKLKEKKSEI